jgi:hypothetical protein
MITATGTQLKKADASDQFGVRDLPIFLYFAVCLIPINIGVLSVNYLFVLYPIWCLFSGRTLRLPPLGLLVALGWYASIFVVGAVAGYWSDGGFELRSATSFVIFACMFALMFFDLSEREVTLFKLAVIATGICFALVALFDFFGAGGNAIGFAQKDIVGSQRYGFVYLIAVFVVLSKNVDLRLQLAMKLPVMVILMAGMLLTFSRSTIVTFVAAVSLYILLTLFEERKNIARGLKEISRRFALVVTSLVVLYVIVPLPFHFYNQQILLRYFPVLQYLVDSDQLLDLPLGDDNDQSPEIVRDVFNKVGSEGTRIVLWSIILDHVDDNPVLGSRYLGVWTLEGAPSGSAHNQLFDVLLRTGWPGLIIYVLLLGRLSFSLWYIDRGLFWGLVATIIYGNFHETFKESQGAFILAFLVGVLTCLPYFGAF